MRAERRSVAPPFDVVYFAAVDWSHTWQRPQQLAARLSSQGRVLYVEPLGLRSVRLGDLARMARRLRGRPGDNPAGTVTVCRAPAFYLPFSGSAAARCNGRILRRTLVRAMRRAGIREPVLWVGTPSAAVLQAVEGIGARLLVYDCLDDFALFHPGGSQVTRTEQVIASRADLVLATSQQLLERMQASNPRALLVPNGADFEHFSKAATPQPPPVDLAGIPRPILGYVGEIAGWFDVEAVDALAAENPGWSVVLIGPLHLRAHSLFGRPNVRYLGRKAYEDLPRYLSQFDVCLLPFKLNVLTSAVNPVKLYEYLASGKPVVSTPLREVLPYRDVVSIAEGRALSGAVEAALQAGGDMEARRRRMDVARENTWEHRLDAILRAMKGTAAA